MLLQADDDMSLVAPCNAVFGAPLHPQLLGGAYKGSKRLRNTGEKEIICKHITQGKARQGHQALNITRSLGVGTMHRLYTPCLRKK